MEGTPALRRGQHLAPYSLSLSLWVNVDDPSNFGKGPRQIRAHLARTSPATNDSTMDSQRAAYSPKNCMGNDDALMKSVKLLSQALKPYSTPVLPELLGVQAKHTYGQTSWDVVANTGLDPSSCQPNITWF